MNKDEEQVVAIQQNKPSTFVSIIVFTWMILGLLGFVTSLVCFSYGGTFVEKWVGLLVSVTLGPFYWLYLLYSDSYCKSSGKQQLQRKIREFSRKKPVGSKKK